MRGIFNLGFVIVLFIMLYYCTKMFNSTCKAENYLSQFF